MLMMEVHNIYREVFEFLKEEKVQMYSPCVQNQVQLSSIAPAIEKNQLHLWVGSLLHISCFPCLACSEEKIAFYQILFEQEILKPK